MQYWKLRSAANLGGDEEELPLMSTACKWFVCVYRTRGWPCLTPRQQCRHHSVAEAGNSRWKQAREGRVDPATALHSLYSLSAEWFSFFFPLPVYLCFHFKPCLILFLICNSGTMFRYFFCLVFCMLSSLLLFKYVRKFAVKVSVMLCDYLRSENVATSGLLQ